MSWPLGLPVSRPVSRPVNQAVSQPVSRRVNALFYRGLYTIFMRSCYVHRLRPVCRNCSYCRIALGVIYFSQLSVAVAANAVIEEPQGYRMEDYDAPVPAQLTGATTVDAFDVKRLIQEQNAVVIDVIPAHRKPDFLPANQTWIPPEHMGVAGSIWLPDIGYGVLSNTATRYFKDNLEKFTHSNKDHPVIFYCRLDCWMSWNAAKRALSFGYTNVHWFSYGIDGWNFEDFEVQPLTAEPGKRQ